MRRRIALTLTMLLVAIGLLATPAQAAIPPNDDVENATAITAIPFATELSTQDATKQSTDPRTNCSGPESTVWWTYTPSSSGWVVADTAGSNYDTTLAVFTGQPGAFTEVACNDDTRSSTRARMYWNGDAGTTYYLMAGTCCGRGDRGGRLDLTLDSSAPAFSVDSFTLNPVGSVDPATGTAAISGTISCANGPARVVLFAEVQQRIGRNYINGFQNKRITCDGVQRWRMRFGSFDGLFVGGTLHVDAAAFWDAGNGGFIEVPDAVVNLHG